jgi:hypothetical protein
MHNNVVGFVCLHIQEHRREKHKQAKSNPLHRKNTHKEFPTASATRVIQHGRCKS